MEKATNTVLNNEKTDIVQFQKWLKEDLVKVAYLVHVILNDEKVREALSEALYDKYLMQFEKRNEQNND